MTDLDMSEPIIPFICEDTGESPTDGYCPTHRGDGCIRRADRVIQRAEAERDRLREALEEIAAARNWTINVECYGVVMRLADRAQRALTPENDDG